MTLSETDYEFNSGVRAVGVGSVSKPLGFDYSTSREVRGGASVSSATVSATPTGLTLGSATVSSNIVTFGVTASTAGTYYVTCLATMSTGAVIPMFGTIVVGDAET